MTPEEKSAIQQKIKQHPVPKGSYKRHRKYEELKSRYQKQTPVADWEWLSKECANHCRI